MTPHDEELQSRLLRDVAFVEYPAHLALGGLRMLLYALLGVIIVIGTPIYWAIHSPAAKAEVNDELRQSRHTIQVDFSHTGIAEGYDETRHDPEVPYEYLKVSFVTPFNSQPVSPGGRTFLPYCNLGENVSGSAPTTLQVPDHWSLEINFLFQPLLWAEGKSAPMYQSYAAAAYTIAAMRSELASLKHGSVSSGCYEDTPRSPQEGAEAISIQGAPVVRIMYSTKTPSEYGMLFSGDGRVRPSLLITGMCLRSECTPEDFEFNISYDIHGASFTPHQQHAMQALQSIGSDAFWVRVARNNGISSDDTVRHIAAITRAAVKERYFISPK